MFKSTFLSFLLLSVLSCGTGPGTPDALYGKWQGVSRTVENSEEKRNAAAVHFQFNQNKEYKAEFGDQQENGTFRVEGDKLYTTADGQLQKMVKIVRISADTLEMEMNRGGVKENLILKKTQ